MSKTTKDRTSGCLTFAGVVLVVLISLVLVIPNILGRPSRGNPFVYRFPNPSGKPRFVVESYGADGLPGGDGDNADIFLESD